MDDLTNETPETCLIVISRGGAQLVENLIPALPGKTSLHIVERYSDLVSEGPSLSVQPFSLPLRPVLAEQFGLQKRMVLFMPVGAAIRLLAPLLQHKHRDPAVVCVDDAGRFVVSLLSGHIGGADELAGEIAGALEATPVITSASHVKNTLAVDLLGQQFGWQLEADSATITRVSAAVVNGESVGICREAGEPDWWPDDTPLPENVRIFTTAGELFDSGCAAALLITDRKNILESGSSAQANPQLIANSVVYRPRSLVAGMGCRRGVSREHLEALLTSALESRDLSGDCIRCIATADIKGNEAGLLELAEAMGVPLVTFGADELNSMFSSRGASEEDDSSERGGTLDEMIPNPSSTARRLVGVWGVSEPSALLASGAGRLLVSRQKTDRATVAIARIPFRN